MTLYDRVAELNRFDLSRYLPFFCANVRVGSIRRDRVPLLRPFADVFEIEESRVTLAPALKTSAERTAAMTRAVGNLNASREIPRLRGESYSVVAVEDRTLSTPPLFEIDRAAVPYFGIRAFGVHLNGFVRESGGYSLWIARRSKTARLHPDKLDNMVAGGQPAGITPFENMMKEAKEEANIKPTLARTAKAVGHISYCIETGAGLGPATMFVYDLELPADFVPENTDGELQYFELLPAEDVLGIVEEGIEFKPNSNLTVIDFCLRHGVIGPNHPEYTRLEPGLRQ